MENKVLVEIYFPAVEIVRDAFVPINKYLGEVRTLLVKMINEEAGFDYLNENSCMIYNKETGDIYDLNKTIIETDIRNGSRLILL